MVPKLVPKMVPKMTPKMIPKMVPKLPDRNSGDMQRSISNYEYTSILYQKWYQTNRLQIQMGYGGLKLHIFVNVFE